MKDRMEQEIERIILLLQASMPQTQKKQASMFTLLRIAISEMSLILLAVLFGGALAFGVIIAKGLSSPMLTAFCTAPMPMLLLFHRYVLHSNDGIRELEETFQYSYTEMVLGRTIVISCYMLVVLISLSAILQYTASEDFLRLALCGAIPSVYLCTLLLFLSSAIRNQEGISIIAIVLWVALCFSALMLPFNEILQICPTGIFVTIVVIGLILYSVSFYRIKTGGNIYAVGIR